ncbi:MAG: hypothetical protein A4E51_01097 [Methanosaeta sp. PtaU1.Bin055]|jgi:hypothetical protein|nr:MAG: hypothetical protein A4E51_01097 [Methanosaeta sp. PtaU1.Bin055]
MGRRGFVSVMGSSGIVAGSGKTVPYLSRALRSCSSEEMTRPYSSLDPAKTTFGSTSFILIASRRFAVPRQFASAVSRGLAKDRGTKDWAARWKTRSGSLTVRAEPRLEMSARSPSRSFTWGPIPSRFRLWGRIPSALLLISPKTSAPSSTSRFPSFDPTKPLMPVTRTLFPFRSI